MQIPPIGPTQPTFGSQGASDPKAEVEDLLSQCNDQLYEDFTSWLQDNPKASASQAKQELASLVSSCSSRLGVALSGLVSQNEEVFEPIIQSLDPLGKFNAYAASVAKAINPNGSTNSGAIPRPLFGE